MTLGLEEEEEEAEEALVRRRPEGVRPPDPPRATALFSVSVDPEGLCRSGDKEDGSDDDGDDDEGEGEEACEDVDGDCGKW